MPRLVNCRQPHTYRKEKNNGFFYKSPRPVVCKKRQVKRSYTKWGALLVFVGLMWLGLAFTVPGTVAYYWDAEISQNNLFVASLVDFELESPNDFSPEISKYTNATRHISVVDTNSVAFQYRVRAEQFQGELCQNLKLEAFLEGEEKFSGPLVNFEAGDFVFENPEDWDFAASLSGHNKKGQCAFDFVFSGWQVGFPLLLSGFDDIERISSVVAAEKQKHDDKDDDEEDDKDDKEDKDDKGGKGKKGDKGPKPGEKGEKGDKPGHEDGDEGGEKEPKDDHRKYYQEEIGEELLLPEALEDEEPSLPEDMANTVGQDGTFELNDVSYPAQAENEPD